MRTAEISHATAQGLRAEQQDRFVISGLEQGQLLAVMDGHGGPQTADLLAHTISEAFQTALKRQEDSIETALKAAVADLVQRTKQETSGSTLSVVYIPKDQKCAYMAILGDSPIIVLDAKGNVHLSPLHNARTNLQERAAALERGARYSEGYLEDPLVPGEGLQFGRALGDRALSRILSREPAVYSIPLGKDSLVLLATDGVLDSFDSHVEKQLGRLAELARVGQDAQALVQDALRRQTGDNVTVIVWKP